MEKQDLVIASKHTGTDVKHNFLLCYAIFRWAETSHWRDRKSQLAWSRSGRGILELPCNIQPNKNNWDNFVVQKGLTHLLELVYLAQSHLAVTLKLEQKYRDHKSPHSGQDPSWPAFSGYMREVILNLKTGEFLTFLLGSLEGGTLKFENHYFTSQLHKLLLSYIVTDTGNKVSRIQLQLYLHWEKEPVAGSVGRYSSTLAQEMLGRRFFASQSLFMFARDAWPTLLNPSVVFCVQNFESIYQDMIIIWTRQDETRLDKTR